MMEIVFVFYVILGTQIINGLLFGMFIYSAIARKFSSKIAWIWGFAGAIIGIVLVLAVDLFSDALEYQSLSIYIFIGVGTVNGWFIGRAIGKKFAPEYAWIWALVGAVLVTVVVRDAYALVGIGSYNTASWQTYFERGIVSIVGATLAVIIAWLLDRDVIKKMIVQVNALSTHFKAIIIVIAFVLVSLPIYVISSLTTSHHGVYLEPTGTIAVVLLFIIAYVGWWFIGRERSPKHSWLWTLAAIVPALLYLLDDYYVIDINRGLYWSLELILFISTNIGWWFIGRAIGNKITPNYDLIWALVGAATGTAVHSSTQLFIESSYGASYGARAFLGAFLGVIIVWLQKNLGTKTLSNQAKSMSIQVKTIMIVAFISVGFLYYILWFHPDFLNVSVSVVLMFLSIVLGWWVKNREKNSKHSWIRILAMAAMGLALLILVIEFDLVHIDIDLYLVIPVSVLFISAGIGWWFISKERSPRFRWIWVLAGAAMGPALIFLIDFFDLIVFFYRLESGRLLFWSLEIILFIGVAVGWWFIGRKRSSKYAWGGALVGAVTGPVPIFLMFGFFGAGEILGLTFEVIIFMGASIGWWLFGKAMGRIFDPESDLILALVSAVTGIAIHFWSLFIIILTSISY